ncbi:MAG: hydrogen peroxide-inducible genes activator [Bacteroidetes bacterium]|nr:MAG: hydrogen peroxide-inducible genes activator [Bacteroidota bacterium]
MNIRQIEYILAVAEVGNFSQAAEKCCITQSTLSTMVAKFEDEIDIQIFDRSKKPVTITREGQVLISQLRLISGEIRVLDDLVQSLKGELSGEISMGVIPTVAPYILPEFLNDFAQKLPNITFSVSELNTQAITERLLRRELDVGILAIPLEEPLLKEIPLYREPFVLYDCSPAGRQGHARLEHIDFSRFWVLAEGHCLHTQVRKICELDAHNAGAGVNFDFKAGSIESLVRFVEKNQGITLLPFLACLDFPQRAFKKIAYFQPPVPVRTIGLVSHRHFAKTRILDLLESEIKEKIVPLLGMAPEAERVIAPL